MPCFNRRKAACLALWSIFGMNTMANESSIRLWTDVSSAGNLWTIVPHVDAPPGHIFDYEISAHKSGSSGNSHTYQAGHVGLSASGTAAMAHITMSISPNDRCDIEVRLFDGKEIIETQTLALPQRQ